MINQHIIHQLFTTEQPFFIHKHFATLDECHQMKEAIYKIGFEEYINVSPPIGRIGITQFEAGKENKNWYFERAKISGERQNMIFNMSFNPIERLIKLFQNSGKTIYIASDLSTGRPYYSGLIRQINKSALIHADYAPYDAKGWEIGEISAQLAWNLCIQAPASGGDCIVYEKPWDLADDESFRIKNSYGYVPEVLGKSPGHAITVDTGDMYLFNSRNFHEVKNCSGDRITISCFLGLLQNSDIVIWS